MSFQNDSHKGGAHGKTGGNTKGGHGKAGQGTTGGQQGKAGQHTTGGQQGKVGQHSAGGHGKAGQGTTQGKVGQHSAGGHGKAGQGATGGQHGQSAQGTGGNFHPQDIKSLVHNQGRARLCGQEWALKTPSWNDSALQAIISDPKFTVKAAGKPAADGKCTYELSGHGKTIKVTIGR